MRGEKIDLESIKNTIKSDLEGFKQKATVVGGEIKQKAEEFGNEMKNRSGNIRKDLSNVNIQSRGIGHAIGVLFKAFFLFISVIVTFALVTALIGLLFGGAGLLPLKNYFIQGFWQNIMIWGVAILFLLLPVIAILTWLIRRIIGARSRNNYLGYTFGSLWVIGLICLIFLAASVGRHYSTPSSVHDEIDLTAPANGKLTVKIDDSKPYYIDDSGDWMGMNWRHNGPFFNLTEDSVTLNTVRIDVIKSKDSSWHLERVKSSLGNNSAEARNLASQINFPIEQRDSILALSRGFIITPNQLFRNQKVLLVIEMPVGKKILMKKNLDEYKWFTVNRKRWRNNGIDIEWNDSDNDESYSWTSEVEYVMTENGLERTNKNYRDDNNNEEQNRNVLPDSTQKKNPNGDYRYHKPKTTRNLNTPASEKNDEDKDDESSESSATLVLLTNLS
ncbi:MAG TPA: hypothetical protein VGI38_12035 [Puia sp.]